MTEDGIMKGALVIEAPMKTPVKLHNEYNLTIFEGQFFGPVQKAVPPAFQLVQVIDANKIKIHLADWLVIQDEPLNAPVQKEDIIISQEMCFRTREYDSGTDICLKIV